MIDDAPILPQYATESLLECAHYMMWMKCMQSGNLMTSSEISSGTLAIDRFLSELLETCKQYEKQVDILLSL